MNRAVYAVDQRLSVCTLIDDIVSKQLNGWSRFWHSDCLWLILHCVLGIFGYPEMRYFLLLPCP